MSAIPTELNLDPFDPFHRAFQPDRWAKGKSHFQAAFGVFLSAKKRQALNDLYAFCRLVDDISDLEDLHLTPAVRLAHLDAIAKWIRSPAPTENDFWNRFYLQRQVYQYSEASLLGVIEGVRFDLVRKPLRVESWDELNQYVQGVAVCVGELVLCILGLRGEKAAAYALNLGRCMQYLNILRDIEEDFKNGRIYLPQVALKDWGATDSMCRGEQRLSDDIKKLARADLYRRALAFRTLAQPYSRRCLMAELIAGVYLKAAKKYWQHGDSRRLSGVEKFSAVIQAFGNFLLR